MTDVLDDIRFLGDSTHRAVVLSRLDEGPCSRATLREATGASSATVGRILQSFEERGWLTRDGSTYRLTAVGAFVARTFARFRRELVLADELAELLPHVPLDEIGIGVDRLADAFVTRATQTNPFAVVSRVRELELDSAAALSLTDFFPEPCIDGRYEAIVHGTQTFEAVFAPVVVDAAMASDSADKFAAIVGADRTEIAVYDGPIPQPVMFHDGIACLVVRDEENISIGMIETNDPTVVEWVLDVFERFQSTATPLSPADFTEPLDGVLSRT
jgi:predicted transcriptional regulator